MQMVALIYDLGYLLRIQASKNKTKNSTTIQGTFAVLTSVKKLVLCSLLQITLYGAKQTLITGSTGGARAGQSTCKKGMFFY